ncbi:hypothetical protein ACW2QC_15135 [Virgibacillus sp. FSP13]
MGDYLSITNKIKVFISSRCGDDFERYNKVRRELKRLIESSQIADVYLFEEEGASTQTAQQDYLYAIDDSDLCLFLIDNYDDVTPAIVKEISRAKSHPKKSIFLFCDENEEKPTQIQNELKGATGSKYYVVNNFQEFIKHGYEDLMNDITKIYRHYCRNRLVDIEFENDKNENVEVATSVFSDSISKQNFRGIDKSKFYIGNLIYPLNIEIEDSTEIDDYVEQFLRVLWGEKGIKEFNVGLFLEKLGENQDKELNEIVKLRWQAIQSYWLDDLNMVNKYLNDAFRLSNKKSMPDWFIQDILIDLRNVERKRGQLENKIVFETNAQKEINKMSQELFYPVIDRSDKQFYEEINKEYRRYKSTSIYSVRYGNNLTIYTEQLAKIFVTACYYGSLTHILLLRNRIRDVAFHLCEEYDDWEFRVLLIKLSMVTDDSKKIKEYITIYNNILGKMNSKDVMEIYDFTNSLPIKLERLKSKLEVIKHLGYFFSDTDYKLIFDELSKEIVGWIEQENRAVMLGDLIISTIQENRFRIDSNLIVDICIKIIDKKMYRFYDKVFGLLEVLDFSNVIDRNLELLKKSLIESALDQEVRNNSNNLIKAIINLTQQVNEYKREFNPIVKENMTESDNQLYLLETTDTIDTFYVLKYIEEIRNNINTQGKKGIYSFGAYNPYVIIKNIFKLNPDIVEFNQANDVITVCKESILANNISYSEKTSAIQLIIYIKLKFNKININYGDLYNQLVNNEELMFDSTEELFQKHSQLTLKLNFIMFQMVLNKMDIVELIDILAEVNNEEEFELVQCLKAIINAINNEFFIELDNGVQNVLLQFVFSLKNHSNQDIRYLAARLLLNMITLHNKKVILTQLSKSMDYDNVYIKNLIINNFDNLWELDKDITKLMLQKASVDNHFLVKKKAKEFFEKNSVQI